MSMCDGWANPQHDIVLLPIDPINASTLERFDSTHPEYAYDAQGRQCIRVDRCMVPALKALWAAGIPTISCCCGHDGGFPCISLERPVPTGERDADG